MYKRTLKSTALAFVIGLSIMLQCPLHADANQNVASSGQTIPAKQIRSAVKQFVLDRAPWGTDQATIKNIGYNQPIAAKAGKVDLMMAAPRHTDWLGAVPITVRVFVDGHQYKRVTVPVTIEVWRDVIAASKPLGKHQPVQRSDVQVKKMNLARLPSNVVTDIEQVIGRRTKRTIAANCVLRSDHIEVVPVINRGDIVQVVAPTPILKIAVKGVAKESGGLGERIKVINLRSKKAIYAKVVNDQTVAVEF